MFRRFRDVTPVDSEMFLRLSETEMSGEGWGVACLVLLIIPAVFVTAIVLNPDPSGMGTHQQLGLPPCAFLKATGLVCPQCGLTTSFALLVRGRTGEAFRANPASSAGGVAVYGVALVTGFGNLPQVDCVW